MKTKQQKYNEAVQRNTSFINLPFDPLDRKGYYKGMSFSLIKMKLGIRNNDLSHDSLIHSLHYGAL